MGTGDCRHFDELRRFLDLECAGIEIQPDIAAKGRARGYDVLEGTLESTDLSDHLGRYDVVSMNHVLEHVVSPRTMLERARDLLRPGGYLIGQLPTVSSWENKIFGRNWGGYHYPRHLQIPSKKGLGRPPRRGGLHRHHHPVGTPYPDDHLSSEHTRPSRVATPDAQRQDSDLHRATGRLAAVRNHGVAMRRRRHRQLQGTTSPRLTQEVEGTTSALLKNVRPALSE